MAQRTRTQYKALYGTAGTLFPDNTTGDISEADVRAFGEDGADSVPFTADDSYTWAFPSVNAAGTDTYTATLSPPIAAYGSGGIKVQILFANANTGAATINLNGLGPKPITKNGSTALAAGDISAGQALFLFYDGTQFQIQGGGSGTVADASTTVKGIVELATTAETTTGTDTVRAVTPAGVKAAIDALIGGAPGALDTLNELADALGDDAAFATTITNALALKAPLASPPLTGTPTVNGESISPGLEPVDRTGTAIQFDVTATYGSVASPETGNITLNSTGFVKGVVQLCLHNNAGIAPTFGAEFFKIGGSYVTNQLNSIYFHAVSATRIEYTINQTS